MATLALHLIEREQQRVEVLQRLISVVIFQVVTVCTLLGRVWPMHELCVPVARVPVSLLKRPQWLDQTTTMIERCLDPFYRCYFINLIRTLVKRVLSWIA